MQEALSNQALIYTGALFAGMILISAWEGVYPRRAYSQPMGRRWLTNIALVIIGGILVRFLFPLAPILFALYVEEQGLGLFNNYQVALPLSCLASLVLLDLNAWLQHWLLHRVPWLWRLHAVHHNDPDYDFTTGLRFHPLEACYTWLTDALAILLLGTPPIAVLILKTVQAVMASFGHGNIKIPTGWDRVLRRLLVTPDVHRIHHSARECETNSNYAGITPWWDRLFGTYTDQPIGGHEAMTFGLSGYQDTGSLKLHKLLLQPFMPLRPAGLAPTEAPAPPRPDLPT